MGLGCKNHQADDKLSVSSENCVFLAYSDQLKLLHPVFSVNRENFILKYELFQIET